MAGEARIRRIPNYSGRCGQPERLDDLWTGVGSIHRVRIPTVTTAQQSGKNNTWLQVLVLFEEDSRLRRILPEFKTNPLGPNTASVESRKILLELSRNALALLVGFKRTQDN